MATCTKLRALACSAIAVLPWFTQWRVILAMTMLGCYCWFINQNLLSIRYAVPAARQHVQNAMRVNPDLKPEDSSLKNFINCKVKRRSIYAAGSQATDPKGCGFFKSKNYAKYVRTKPKGKGLYLLAQPGIEISLDDHQTGMRLVLVNQTEDYLSFRASDSRLSIIQEAKDEMGAWQAIEYTPTSWCGNSSHRLFLAPNYYWEFAAPRYEGSLKTKIRFSMNLHDNTWLHSNEFEGSINPEQFLSKQKYQPKNIMDPYDN